MKTRFVPRLARRLLVFIFLVLLLPQVGFRVLDRLYPFPVEKLGNLKAPTIVRSSDGTILRIFLNEKDCIRLPVKLAVVDRSLILATVAAEDKRFFTHVGVDWIAVVRATLGNLKSRRIISGASTITMQVVRLLTPRPRTLRSKLIEAFRARQLEQVLSKDGIMEEYLNRTPYGGNLVGVGAASLRYFGKSASDLTVPEAALLAGLPKSPSRLRPDRFPRRAATSRNIVLHRMADLGSITGSELTRSLATPVESRSFSFPFRAPHIAGYINRNLPPGTDVRSSVDLALQRCAERAIRDKVGELAKQGVTNGAVCIIENRSGLVRALVGSVDFHSFANDGQVNGAMAVRSPGSALKPFTYACAFQTGDLSPTKVLGDVPVAYRGYSPSNYDRSYRGPVTVKEALVKSLNIPAIQVLNRVGYDALYDCLTRAGITTLDRPPGHYGLGLTLGSCGVTLLDMTNAYAALARLGIYRPYRHLCGEAAPGRREVLSEEASYLVADMLLAATRPGQTEVEGQADGRGPLFAGKTGTSYGHKDAWCFGYNPEYTVGVWVGNFNGLPSKSLVGRSAALPVVRRIFTEVYRHRNAPWYDTPPDIRSRTVCARSGLVPNNHCLHTREGQYIPGVSPNSVCDVHRLVMVDTETGHRLCPLCCGSRKIMWRQAETWPPDINEFLRSRGLLLNESPAHNPQCQRHSDDSRQPDIISPRNGQEFLLVNLPADGQSREKISLKAAAAPDSAHLFWFVDGSFLARTSLNDTLFWPLAPGNHEIICMDEQGRRSTAEITVYD